MIDTLETNGSVSRRARAEKESLVLKAMLPGSQLEAESLYRSPYFPESYDFPYNPDPLCSGNNYDVYDEMRDDDQVKVAVSFKKDLVVNTGWAIECEYKSIAEEVTRSLQEMECGGGLEMSFEDILRGMVSSAYEFGFSVSEPVFKLEGGKYAYDTVQVRPPHSFRFNIDDGGNVLEIIQATSRGDLRLNPDRFIHYAYQSDFGNPYGRSDLRAAHSAWKAKKFVSKFLAIYLERFASPTIVGKAPANWDHNEIARFQAVLKTVQQSTSLVVPQSAVLDYVQSNRDASDTYIKALHYYNMLIGRAILVPDLMGISGDKTSGGSYSLGQEHFRLFMATVEKDRQALARKITLRLVRQLVRANYGDYRVEFKFLPHESLNNTELLRIWSEAVRGGAFKPNQEEVNHLRKQLKFPEGPVEIQEPVPVQPPGLGEMKLPGQEIPQQPSTGDGLNDEKGRAFASRALTSAEKKVDFAKVQEVLDSSEKVLARRLGRAARAIWTDYLRQVKELNIVKDFRPESLENLEPRFLREMNQELRGAFLDLLQESHEEARSEVIPVPERKFGLEEGELEFEDMMKVLETEAFNITKDYKGLASKKVNSEVVKGLKQGLSQAEIIAAIRKQMPDITDRWIDTLVRTKTTEIYNRGRKSYFDNDPVAKQIIQAYQYSAIIDARTSEVCTYLDGRVFASDDPNIGLVVPALHFNCRSILVAVTKFEKGDLENIEPVPEKEVLIGRGANLI